MRSEPPIVSLLVAGAVACGTPAKTPLYPAGDSRDDGAGVLARNSAHLRLGDDATDAFGADQRPTVRPSAPYGGDSYGGDPYGGAMYSGDPYGGVSYANWSPPQPTYVMPSRQLRYTPVAGLSGAIEGTVTWAGAPPPKVATPCGLIDNPTVRVGDRKGLRGVVVYIEKVNVGRLTPMLARPPVIGGVIVKRGCALVPAAQFVASQPPTLAIHGDATRARVRIDGQKFELQEGGLVDLDLKQGVTKVESDDGTLAAAWAITVDSPYYALTDDAGHYRIEELAPGTYDVTFWQAPVTTVKDGALAYGSPIVTHRSVTVAAAKTSQLSAALK